MSHESLIVRVDRSAVVTIVSRKLATRVHVVRISRQEISFFISNSS